jgi:hypothetical protein
MRLGLDPKGVSAAHECFLNNDVEFIGINTNAEIIALDDYCISRIEL